MWHKRVLCATWEAGQGCELEGFGEILGEPDLVVLGVDEYVDTDEGVGGEDVEAMAVVGWLLIEHEGIEAGGGALGVATADADVFRGLAPMDADIGDACAEGGFAGELMGELVGFLHREVMVVRALHELVAPLERGQASGGAFLVDLREDCLGSLCGS